ASTDAGIPGVYHHHLPQALPVFAVIAGLTPEAALRTATSAAAKGLGLGLVTGRLKPGLSADIVLVHGNPLDDLAVLAEPAAVWARGVEAKGLS
ncbi:MAG: amidohydrolase family protein, partial [Gammaproteobacteria bacterium]|nr:amidohydrolase family protein [Gammaproteobacteria bacterium]